MKINTLFFLTLILLISSFLKLSQGNPLDKLHYFSDNICICNSKPQYNELYLCSLS